MRPAPAPDEDDMRNQLRTVALAAPMAVSETHRPLEKAFDLAPAGMCVLDVEGEVLRANTAFWNLMGGPDLLAPSRTLLASLLSAGRDCGSTELRRARAGLPSLWVRVTISVVRGSDSRPEHAVVLVEDVTSRKQAEADLRKSERDASERLRDNEELFRAVVEQSADGMLVIDEAGTIRMANAAARELFTSASEEIVGQPFDYPLDGSGPREQRIAVDGHPPRIVEMRDARVEMRGRPVRVVNVRDVTDMARLRDELRALSLLDELTRLYNRRGFLTLGQQQIALANRSRRAMVVVFADLDGMKWINDTQGHQEGDRALVDMAAIFRETFRQSDVVARIGGDEFAAISLEARQNSADIIETRLRRNLDVHNRENGRSYRLSVSLGLASYDPAAPCSIEDLLACADERMYQQKRSRKAVPLRAVAD